MRILLVLMVFLMSAFGGCSDRKAKDLYETAQFEELQNNKPHAMEIYRKILEKYPDTEYAQKAKERLDAMN